MKVRKGNDKQISVSIRRDKLSEMKAQRILKNRKRVAENCGPSCPFCQGLSRRKGDEEVPSRLAKKQLGIVSNYAEELLQGQQVNTSTLKLEEACSSCFAMVRNILDLHLETMEIKEEIARVLQKLFKKCLEETPQGTTATTTAVEQDTIPVSTRTPTPKTPSSSPRRSPRQDKHFEIVVKDESDLNCSCDDDEMLGEVIIPPEEDCLNFSPVGCNREDETAGSNEGRTSKSPSPRPQRKSRAEALLKKIEEADNTRISENENSDNDNFQLDDDDNDSEGESEMEDENDNDNERTRKGKFRVNPKDVIKVSDDEWKCRKCGTTCKARKNVHAHICRKHNPNVRQYTCPQCKKSFRSSDLLKAHIQVVHEKKLFSCRNCGKKMRSKRTCRAHQIFCLTKDKLKSKEIGNDHDDESSEIAEKVTTNSKIYDPSELGLIPVGMCWKCSECGRVLKDLRVGSNHVRRIHRAEKTVTCEKCGYSCFSPSDLNRHMKRHHLKEGFPCQRCGHLWVSERAKIIHEATVCKVEYPEEELKKRAIQIITCSYPDCGYMAGYEKTMKAHQIKHVEDTPFQCEECGQSFKHEKSLEAHLRRNHKPDSTGRKYPCTVCDASFKNRRDRSVHERRVHGDPGEPEPELQQVQIDGEGYILP